ncbi:MAG: VCBS repeat-containing protein [Planctomycetota bacterium]|nr:VCBS repeat-containing protein [Planctomycetota bacterium]
MIPRVRPALAIALLPCAVAAQQFGAAQVISNTQKNSQSVHSADLDGDGDMDVLATSWGNDRVTWYENTDGAGSFGPMQVITSSAVGARAVVAADIDGDGDMDVVCASDFDDKVRWFRNLDGLGSFGNAIVVASIHSPRAVFVGDLDGDGDVDVIAPSYFDSEVGWYENSNGLGSFNAKQLISSATFGALTVSAADVDGDGDLDALSGSELDDEVSLFVNTDGLGSFGAQVIISAAADSVRLVHADDLDGDGDPDVLSASHNDDKVAWYENSDGLGSYGAEQIITTSADSARAVTTSDLDGDGDADVIAAAYLGDYVAWYENTDGLGSFGTEQLVVSGLNGAHGVFAADLNGDGSQDVLSASWLTNEISWYENLAAPLNASPATISLTTGGSQQMSLKAGTAFAGLPYLVLGSTTGTTPGIPIDSWLIPLNLDGYTTMTLIAPNSGPLGNTFGLLDSSGAASASFTVPAGMPASLVGVNLDHAAVVIELLPTLLHLVFVSNAVSLQLVP